MKELITIQNKLKIGKNNSKEGIKFMYRTTADILERVKPLCLAEGVLLTVSDEIVNVGDSNYIKSTATVMKDDKSISCSGLAKEPIKLMAMSAPQITGSCSSYARKTALGGLFAIDDNEDPDSGNNRKDQSEVTDVKQLIFNALNHVNVPKNDRDRYFAGLKSKAVSVSHETLDKIIAEYNI